MKPTLFCPHTIPAYPRCVPCELEIKKQARSEALEEAANVADGKSWDGSGIIAKQIRALKEQKAPSQG